MNPTYKIIILITTAITIALVITIGMVIEHSWSSLNTWTDGIYNGISTNDINTRGVIAQERMANTADYMLLLAAISLIATGAAGAFALIAALATAESAKTAREVGEAEARAYLTTTSVEAEAKFGSPRLFVTVKNSGNSTAIDVHVVLHAWSDRNKTEYVSITNVIGSISPRDIQKTASISFPTMAPSPLQDVIIFSIGCFGKDVFNKHIETFHSFPMYIPQGGNAGKQSWGPPPLEWYRLPPNINASIDIPGAEEKLRANAWSEAYLMGRRPKEII